MKGLVYFILLFLSGMLILLSMQGSTSKIDLISNELIYASNEHAAFTSMTDVDDTLFVAFREGKIHNPRNKDEYGHLNILKIVNNNPVDTFCIKCDTADLRDPFFININGTLRLYCFYTQRKNVNEGKNYGGTIYYNYNNGTWSESNKVIIPLEDTYILWKIREIDKEYYSIGYNMKKGPILFQSRDGIEWDPINKISNNGNYTEGDVIKNGDNLIYIIRNEDSIPALSVIANKNSETIKFLSRSISCPELLRIDNDHILCAGREYDFISNKNRPDSIDVTVLLLDNKCAIKDRIVIPTNRLGDKGYASFWLNNDTIYMSYYYGLFGKSNIYLAKLLIR